jgi:hypothetical protein
MDKKYVLSFPTSKQSIVFDRERLCFYGPWPTSYGIRHWAKFVDSNGDDKWIAADSTDAQITEFSPNYRDDKGIAIRTLFKSKKENFGDWTILKTINEIYMNFRAVSGSLNVNIYVEDRTGKTVTAKSFTVTSGVSTGTSGIGTDKIGDFLMGMTNNKTGSNVDEMPQKIFVYKSSRLFQVEIRTNGLTDSYELLGIKAIAIPQARGNSPSSWNI